MIKYFRRRRALRSIAELSPDEAAYALRSFIAADAPVDPRVMLTLTERAIEGAEGVGRSILLKYADAYRAGRRIKFGTGTTLYEDEGETPQLVADVESAFTQGERP